MNNILIVDMNKEKNSLHHDEFVLPVKEIVKTNFDIIHFLELNEQVILKYEKVILCGVALKDFEYLNHTEIFNWMKNYKGYILGICAGAQIIGKIFGAELKEKQEIGLVKISKVKEDSILEKVSLNEVYALHKSYSELPQGFNLLLETKIPQLFSNGKIYASLFHPEIRNKKLIENFINF
ncbi:MAG: hypothetical protein PF569_07640 [Candidatus Woesearchaeota archaeon]|jgi:GMP synthase-like glutamine amidotransferase|nr:hypothetical protein [Candidatus Woesearchaeota archaeon]